MAEAVVAGTLLIAGTQVVLNILDHFGIVLNGTVKDCGNYMAFMNDWEARDSRAHAEGTFEDGRFSYQGTVHGRWYCCLKRRWAGASSMLRTHTVRATSACKQLL